MKKYILHFSSDKHRPILEISKPINQAYADKFGFNLVVDHKIRCAERDISWEKIAFLNAMLPKLEEGSLVIWEDVDSLNIGNEDATTVLPEGAILGMVQNRGGVGNKKLVKWHNSGIIFMYNIPTVREFFVDVFKRTDILDEDAIIAELKDHKLMVGTVPLTNLDPKWNCWKNNEMFCDNPVIRTFHGMKFEEKLPAMESYLSNLKK